MTTLAETKVEPRVEDSRMTAAQFSRIHNPERIRLELVKGELHVSPRPRPRHSRVVIELLSVLRNHVKGKQLGEMFIDLDTTISPWDVRCPDLLLVPQERVATMDPDAAATHADAKLVVEVVSPGSERVDRQEKFSEYAAAGIPHYWIVDPRTRVAEAYELADGEYRQVKTDSGTEVLAAPPFADLEIPLQPLWWN